jgi:hypothetical protein
MYESPNNSGIVIIGKDSLQKIGDYRASIHKNLNFTDSNNLEERLYCLAISYALLHNADSAFYYLDKYLDISIDDRLIIVDKNFDVLRTDSTRWKIIVNKIEHLYLDELDSTVNKELALRLFYLGIEDQLYRSYLPKLGQIPYDSTGRFYYYPNNKPMNELEKIIKQYGFPTISMVGKLGSKNAFLILQHSEKITRYYRRVKKAYKQNEINSLDFALLTDRYLGDMGRKQLYGTQLIQTPITLRKYPGKYILCPVKDFKNVNKRRKEVGFKSTVEEYVASWESDKYIIPEKYYKKKHSQK